ncbi:MAG TPA: universal stress protein [Ktedonobacteraceae bacterium]|nr:universal stress protein [Ktedonobacteraceae bacterium]
MTLAAIIGTPLFNPVGILIGIVFIASILSVLGWMLRLPKETEEARSATRAVRSVNKLTRILVPVLHKNEVTDRTVALAVQMAQHRNGNVEALAALEVPLMLPLDAKVEDDEQCALALLDRAESVAAHTHSSSKVIKRLLKARSAGAAIVREAEEKGVDLIIIANVPVRVRGSMQQIDPTVEYVLKNAPCEVMVLSQLQPLASQLEVSAKVALAASVL